ncbi:MAG: hypothetical protein V3V56_08285 [bacterium]
MPLAIVIVATRSSGRWTWGKAGVIAAGGAWGAGGVNPGITGRGEGMGAIGSGVACAQAPFGAANQTSAADSKNMIADRFKTIRLILHPT